MNKKTADLLEKVNEKLKHTPLVYFSREIERGLGLENVLDNYYQISIEDGYIARELKKTKPGKIFTITTPSELKSKSTLELINNRETLDWIKNNIGNKFYAQLFQFNKPAYNNIEKLGGVVLNNNSELNKQFEEKLNQYNILKENNIKVPKAIISQIDKLEFKEIIKSLGEKIVIQQAIGHTGIGTFIISSEEEFNKILHNLRGNIVKITEFIEGETYTTNGCITKEKVFNSAIQYQITGISELTSSKGTTVGNDWSYANKLDRNIKDQIYKITQDVGVIMKRSGFRGLYGVDIVVKESDVYLIEINARQTANISMQTKLELIKDTTPLSLIHIAEFLDIDTANINYDNEELKLEGSQLFLRSKSDNNLIKNSFQSGIYSEDIKIKDGFEINQITNLKDEYLLIVQDRNTIKNIGEEIARIQLLNSIIDNGKIKDWSINTLKNIEDKIL